LSLVIDSSSRTKDVGHEGQLFNERNRNDLILTKSKSAPWARLKISQ
jgi:hypothetical protein